METSRSSLLTRVALVALLVGGCSMVPKYRRPDTAVPAAWQGKSEASAAVAAGAGWWRTFGSAELDALVARGEKGSFDLQAAVARVDEARARAGIAAAALYPSISLGGAGNAGVGPGTGGVQSVFAQASYEIDFWGKHRAARDSARALADATAFDAETVKLTLESSVTDTYFEILSLSARVRLAQAIAASARRILALVEAQAAGGIASRLEVEQQRNAVATFDAAVPALQQQLEQDLHLVGVLVGAAPEGFNVAGRDLDGLSIPEVKAGLPSSILERRPDIRAAEQRLVSANFDIGAARAAFLPSFSLTAQAGLASAAVGSFSPPMLLADLVGHLMQPLFEGGRLRGQLKLDRAHAVELTATYRQTVLNALKDVEDALTAIARLKELESLDTVAVDAARKAAELSRAQFDVGTADFLNVLLTERTLYQAEDALLQVRLQRLEATVGLFRALGGGFEPPPAAAPRPPRPPRPPRRNS